MFLLNYDDIVVLASIVVFLLIVVRGDIGAEGSSAARLALLPSIVALFAGAFLIRLILQSFSIIVESHYRTVMPEDMGPAFQDAKMIDAPDVPEESKEEKLL